MKFSYHWLREFVKGLDAPAETLEQLITIKTAECEGIEQVSELLAHATLARVEKVTPIEGSHNAIALVDAGRYGQKTVVCGAKNCRPGVVTVWVPLGFKTIAGIESDGMLASAAELGISRDHEGIIELTEDARLPAPDSIIEIDNKSITHRPDLWGHYGMAREVAAITGQALHDPVHLDLIPGADCPTQIKIEDFTLCPRYSALVFENVTVMPSPLWLQQRLTAVGLNPKNNLVDLTNYLMAELAQPMHAFDAEKLNGGTIFVRPARAGERMMALNDEEYELAPSNLVIADALGPIAIAGVIGGRDTAISAGTTSIVLESANFQASSVRKTSAALKLRTDASMRFEKAQDPHNTVRALARAIELLQEISPGARLVGGLGDSGRKYQEPPPIELNLDWLAAKLGRDLDREEVWRILESLQFGVTETGPRTFSVNVPSWRATKDISMPEDLVEEVGRMIGYDSIEPAPPLIPCAPSFDPPEREFLRGVKRMAAAQGFNEVSNYSFISEEEAGRFSLAVERHLRVLNPIAAGQELMRRTLLPGIYRNIVENAKHLDTFRIFEAGREIHSPGDERTHLVAAIYAKDDGRAALLELKRLAECLAPGVAVKTAEANPWEHPARCVALVWKGEEIGRIAELHPGLIESGRAATLDIDLELLRELSPAATKYTPVRRFPASAFDLSIIAGARDLAADLAQKIKSFAGNLAEAVDYVREYQGPPVPEGRKSVTFRITLADPTGTLQDEDITAARARILAGLNDLGYDTRV
ncbi:MAG TPA: phenylalanine--tRNA ligase subunit beta [Bryobacteraceae bacterium]|jgi:phenylalanyl-tRNA synthetase beta chain|nr:phenylalanine--tRNA ligase subunit beta [Bryobacteraceae bacterium]